MRYILTAVFTDRGIAQQALDALRGAGYPDDDAVLVAIPGAGPASGPGWNTASTWPQAGTPGARVLGWIFGHGNPEGTANAPWRAPDAYRLTLAAQSEHYASRACALVPDFVRAGTGSAVPDAPRHGPGRETL